MGSAPKTKPSLVVTIIGVVQGVGFRPFIYRLARSLGLTGTVSNTGDGVRVLISGSKDQLEQFLAFLPEKAPPAANITSIEATEQPPDNTTDYTDFTIIPSRQNKKATVHITPDMAICEDCKREILDPSDRRYRYPFTNCTNCGPRFTIINKVPYDRPYTSMAAFEMCPACAAEYNDPMNRRFHAQPNACPVCGPHVSWYDHTGTKIPVDDCITTAAEALRQGKVVAIKGLGGFHLAVNACSEKAVANLRSKKKRPFKPLAIMVRDVADAEQFCTISDKEQKLLTSPQHPIVLLTKKNQNFLADGIAPNLGVIGVMLPYTPLHCLLFNEPSIPTALVMTSGNKAGAPICISNEDAINKLGDLADFFLLHNRDIVTRVDDSVARVVDNRICLIRRARGYAPVPLHLNKPCSDILACGAEQKSTFCVIRNNEAYLSQHIGELTNFESFIFFEESLTHLQSALQYTPKKVACDQHPDYLSTRYARKLKIPLIPVQHHHAHIGAVMAEHNLDQQVLGVVLDGTGYSEDGTVFGGEIYLADRHGFERKAHLSHFRLPGGDRAAKEPWRMAISLLFSEKKAKIDQSLIQIPALKTVPTEQKEVILQMLKKKINSPLTSSCGRLFDAIAALVGVCLYSTYEGQAAMELEYQASCFALKHPKLKAQEQLAYTPMINQQNNLYVISASELAKHIYKDLQDKRSIGHISWRFHGWLIHAITTALIMLRKETGIKDIVLGGGCMHNSILLRGLHSVLSKHDFSVYSGEIIPVNDGGIALGQAYIAE